MLGSIHRSSLACNSGVQAPFRSSPLSFGLSGGEKVGIVGGRRFGGGGLEAFHGSLEHVQRESGLQDCRLFFAAERGIVHGNHFVEFDQLLHILHPPSLAFSPFFNLNCLTAMEKARGIPKPEKSSSG